jgi:uncharacterized membrane protein YcfT
MKQKMMWIVWPAFLMAGVMELLVFAVVDPQDMHWFGQTFEMSRQTVYTLGFFVFWFVTALAGALTLFLSLPPNEVNQSPL